MTKTVSQIAVPAEIATAIVFPNRSIINHDSSVAARTKMVSQNPQIMNTVKFMGATSDILSLIHI